MNPTERFTNRVENYRRYRPGYPRQVIELIRETARPEKGAAMADIGSGTGILSRLLVDAEWNVDAVEPNAAMREAAESDLAFSPRFRSLAGRAEATGLSAGSVCVVTCAQAFHWFEQEAAWREFRRILTPDGWVFIIWNVRLQAAPFDQAYQGLLASLGLDYEGVRDRGAEQALESFFRPGTYGQAAYPNPTPLHWGSLLGRFLSSSYVPAEEGPRQAKLIADLKEIFDLHQKDGTVVQE